MAKAGGGTGRGGGGGGLSASERREGRAFYATLSDRELSRRLSLTRTQMREAYPAAMAGDARMRAAYERLFDIERELIAARMR